MENFQGRKLSQIGENYDLREENMLPFAVPTDAMPPNFVERTFANSHKTSEIYESFLPQKFSAILYVHQVVMYMPMAVKLASP